MIPRKKRHYIKIITETDSEDIIAKIQEIFSKYKYALTFLRNIECKNELEYDTFDLKEFEYNVKKHKPKMSLFSKRQNDDNKFLPELQTKLFYNTSGSDKFTGMDIVHTMLEKLIFEPLELAIEEETEEEEEEDGPTYDLDLTTEEIDEMDVLEKFRMIIEHYTQVSSVMHDEAKEANKLPMDDHDRKKRFDQLSKYKAKRAKELSTLLLSIKNPGDNDFKLKIEPKPTPGQPTLDQEILIFNNNELKFLNQKLNSITSEDDGIKLDSLNKKTSFIKQCTRLKPNAFIFPHIPCIEDIKQTHLGDCYFLAALMSIVKNEPKDIMNMMRDNLNGTATVRLYNPHFNDKGNFTYSTPKYIAVPKPIYEDEDSTNYFNTIWVKILERAFAIIGGNFKKDKACATQDSSQSSNYDTLRNKTRSINNIASGASSYAFMVLTGKGYTIFKNRPFRGIIGTNNTKSILPNLKCSDFLKKNQYKPYITCSFLSPFYVNYPIQFKQGNLYSAIKQICDGDGPNCGFESIYYIYKQLPADYQKVVVINNAEKFLGTIQDHTPLPQPKPEPKPALTLRESNTFLFTVSQNMTVNVPFFVNANHEYMIDAEALHATGKIVIFNPHEGPHSIGFDGKKIGLTIPEDDFNQCCRTITLPTD